MKLGTLLWEQSWLQGPKELVNAGWLHSMLVSLVCIYISVNVNNFFLMIGPDFHLHFLDCIYAADTVPLRTVNRQCSSGLQAVADVAAAIKAGFYDIGKVNLIIYFVSLC